MPEVQVKKVVAVCFLEAVKMTLDHIGAYRLELSQQGVPGSPDLPRTYGEVRRLRDYLQRCVSAFQELVDLDLPPADAGLLVACCRRSVEAMDLRLSEQAVTPDERAWLQRKRQVVSDWAVELADKPLLELPLKKMTPVASDAVRALTTRLQNKVFGDVRERAKIVAPNTAGPSMTAGLQSFGDQLRAIDPADSDPGSDALASAARGTMPGGRQGGGAFGLGRDTLAMSPETADQGAGRGRPTGAPMPETTAQVGATMLFEPSKLRDPRLRSLAGMDAHTYERLAEVGDHRLATVLLASLLESAVLDYATARRAEFGLAGSPDTWNLQDLLLKALGERAAPQDRAMAFHLFASRNLLRPALQMVTPAVVTSATFDRLREFVQRALHDLGYGLGTLPPGALKAGDV
jgi:hypothetical protein